MRRSVNISAQGPAQLDRGNPLLEGLIGFVNGSVNSLPMDMLSRQLMTRVGVNLPGSSGVGQSATGANGIYSGRNAAAFASWRPTTSPLTLMLYVTCGTSVASTYIGGSVGNGGGTEGFQFQLTNGDGTIRFVSFIGGSAKAVLSAGGVWSNGKKLLLTLVLDGTNIIGYVNGFPVGSTAASGTITYDTSFGRVQLLGSPDFTGTTGSGHWMGLWNRAMQPAEIKSLADSPMQVFAPLVKNLFVASAAGGAGNATGTFDVITITPPTATGNGKANASATPSSVSITTPTATAAGGSVGNATGSLDSVTLSPPTATASGKASASATPAGITITPPTATASSGGTGNAFATFMALVLSPAAATASGGASASGSFPAITITGPTAYASGDAPVAGQLDADRFDYRRALRIPNAYGPDPAIARMGQRMTRRNRW